MTIEGPDVRAGAEPYDVTIVGYGPAGEVLANLLGAAGRRVAVVERGTSVHRMPRAAHFDQETMRVFQSVGLAETVLAATTSLRGMHFMSADRRKLFGIDQPPGPTASGWSNNYMFYQPELEALLREGAARFGGVQVLLGHEVESVAEHDDHVEIEVRDLASGTSRRIGTRWLVGSDGANSTVRRLMGARLDDLGFDESWLVADVLLKRPIDLPEVVLQICDPARPSTFVPMPGNRRRWEFMVLPGEDPATLEDPATVLALLEPWVPADAIEVERAGVYTVHALIAEGWRSGRLALVGDAAHQMPPFLGQGMSSGVRDVANLAWKLRLVLDGVCDERLLDSYETERAPQVRAITTAAITFGSLICATDRAVAAARDEQFLSGHADAPGDVTTFVPSLGPGICQFDGETVADHAGKLFVQPWVAVDGEEVRLDDLLGGHFAVVTRAGDPRSVLDERSLASLARLGTRYVTLEANPVAGLHVITERDGYLTEWFTHRNLGVAVLRPDCYVFGTAAGLDGVPALVAELLERLPLLDA